MIGLFSGRSRRGATDTGDSADEPEAPATATAAGVPAGSNAPGAQAGQRTLIPPGERLLDRAATISREIWDFFTDPTDRPKAGLRRTQWAQVAAALLAITVFTIAWPTFGLTHSVPAPLVPVMSLLIAAPGLLWVRFPLRAWMFSVAAAGIIALFHNNDNFDMAWPVVQFIVILVTYAVALLRADTRQGWVIGFVTASLALLCPVSNGAETFLSILFFVTLFALLLRWLLSSRRALRAQAAATSAERQSKTEAQERSQLARDLHDVVAHQMSMVVIQAQSAPYRLQDVSAETAAEFDSLAQTARKALDEIRGLLGVLRNDGTRELSPVGADQIETMLAESRSAGMPLSWNLALDPTTLPQSDGLVLYRVLQESLANATRHAPGAAVTVRLFRGVPGPELAAIAGGQAAAAEGVVLAVYNPAPPAHSPLRLPLGPSPAGSSGAGIPGMTARAAAIGGLLRAEPTLDDGFIVRLWLPGREADGAEVAGGPEGEGGDADAAADVATPEPATPPPPHSPGPPAPTERLQ